MEAAATRHTTDRTTTPTIHNTTPRGTTTSTAITTAGASTARRCVAMGMPGAGGVGVGGGVGAAAVACVTAVATVAWLTGTCAVTRHVRATRSGVHVRTHGRGRAHTHATAADTTGMCSSRTGSSSGSRPPG